MSFLHNIQRRLPHYNIEHLIGILNLTALIASLAQWFTDLLMVTSFRAAQTTFQRVWLCLHFGALNALVVVLLYGFNAALLQSTRSYHGISTFRSWLLFLGTLLTFSGFFVVIGYAKDDALFAIVCSHGFNQRYNAVITVTGLADISTAIKRSTDAGTVYDAGKCQQIFRALLSTYLILWTLVQILLLALFLCVRHFKRVHFHTESLEEKEEKRQQLARRNGEEVNRNIERASAHSLAAAARGQHGARALERLEGTVDADTQDKAPRAQSVLSKKRVTFDETSLLLCRPREGTPIEEEDRLSMHSDLDEGEGHATVDTALAHDAIFRSGKASPNFKGTWQEEAALAMLNNEPRSTAYNFPMPPERSYSANSRISLADESFARLTSLIVSSTESLSSPEATAATAIHRLDSGIARRAKDGDMRCENCHRRISHARTSQCRRLGQRGTGDDDKADAPHTLAPQIRVSFIDSLDRE